ncbi:unnamed protein product [Callosobruchus maculatus]|uniref:Uncharacterized protein n=1 Tax=Callosobruchus maculatus TaxID=64391 RepID=A0A653CPL2_CALMS|nr:unnamed protein product [Callosobruchus maculatus]
MEFPQVLSRINLNQITLDEEEDNFIYQIREDLIENVMKEIDAIEAKGRLIKFVADCAYEALVKLLSIEFYHHNATVDPTKGAWIPDEPPTPSKPDTWAANNIPIIPKDKTEQPVEDKLEDEPEPVCTCTISVVCECHKKLEDRILAKQLESLDNFHQSAAESESASPTSSSLDITLTQTPSEESVSSPPVSLESEEEGSEVIEPDPDKCAFQEGLLKTGSVQDIVLPKITVAGSASSVMPQMAQSKIVALPPVRVAAHFDGKPEEVPQKDKKDRKKKSLTPK